MTFPPPPQVPRMKAPEAAAQTATPDFEHSSQDQEARLIAGGNMNDSMLGRKPASGDGRVGVSTPDAWAKARALHPDDDRAACLWVDWQQAEAAGNAWGARWCRERYHERVGARKETPARPLARPFEETLRRLLDRALVDGGDVEALEALIELGREARAPEPPPGWEHGPSKCGWYVSIAGGVERTVCAQCAPPPTSREAVRAHLYPLEPWMVAEPGAVRCVKCGRVG